MRMRLLLGAGLLVATMPALSSVAEAEPRDGDVVPGAYIVTVADGASPDAVAADHGRRLGASVDHVYRSVARGYAARMSASAAAGAAADPRVRAVVPDRVVRISAPKGGGGSTAQPAQGVPPSGVRRVFGGAAAGAGVPVAVIDTGIDLGHPDLNVVGGRNCSSGSSYADGNGHGTHVAGTIGAIDNTIGVVGVAPNTPLYAVRVLNNAGSGTWASVICGVDWVTGSGITVANMSLGGTGGLGSCSDGGLREAICDAEAADVTVVVAAGNESDDAANHVPAAYPEAITVSALADSDGTYGPTTWRASCRFDQEDTLADFSNFGVGVDLIAPGVCITSTWKGGGYKTISGTSMASPHVAAGAALFVARSGVTDPALVKQALREAAPANEWNNAGDPDGVKEPLLRVDAL